MKMDIIKEVSNVITDETAEVICKQGSITVIQNVNGKKVIAKFVGYGIMYIYVDPRETNYENLEGGEIFIIKKYRNPAKAYRKKIAELCK